MKTPLVITLIVIGALIGALIGVGIGYLTWKTESIPSTLPTYFPVEVEVIRYIEKPVPYEIQLPPHITYKYMSYQDSMSLVGIIDSLICLVSTGSSHDTVFIKPNFLTFGPTQPKLINLDLSIDSLSLTLLNINAELFTKVYPLALGGYRYRFDGHNLSAEPFSTLYGIPKPSKWELNLFGYIGTNLINYPTISPMASVEFNVNYSRLRLSIEPTMTLNKTPELGLNTKLGYKLWKWPKK
jgi:hypothetical protein